MNNKTITTIIVRGVLCCTTVNTLLLVIKHVHSKEIYIALYGFRKYEFVFDQGQNQDRYFFVIL